MDDIQAAISKLSPRQRKALYAMFACKSIEAAAKEAGISKRTLQRYIDQKPFMEALGILYAQVYSQAIAARSQDISANTEFYRKLRDSEDAPYGLRIKAAAALEKDLPTYDQFLKSQLEAYDEREKRHDPLGSSLRNIF